MLQHNLLPRNVQRKLRNGETVVAEHHTAATVLWAEVVGLPRLAAAVPPLELVRRSGGRGGWGGEGFEERWIGLKKAVLVGGLGWVLDGIVRRSRL